MSDKYTLDEIRNFWTEQARIHGQGAAASWSDFRVMEMEVREILKHLADGDRVLDVGCANGFSTVQFASQRRIEVRGLDYIPEMIENAKHRQSAITGQLPGSVSFAQGDITDLKEPDDAYDKVITIRVLINLGSWDRQLLALKECARVLRPGGTLLVSEATVQGWQRLNAFRQEWGLSDIPMPPFNQYLDEERMRGDCPAGLRLREVNNFASSYYVGTRVIKPLLGRIAGGAVDVANPAAEWNHWVSELPAAGDYGTQKLFIFEKQ